jgi:hypothetical protein
MDHQFQTPSHGQLCKGHRLRHSVLPALLVFILLCLTGCRQGIAEKPGFQFDSEGIYAGFSSVPDRYTIEQAIKDGCYISDWETEEDLRAANNRVWEEFLAVSGAGRECSIRFAWFLPEGNSYADLYYKDGTFHYFQSDCPAADKGWTMLRTLTGEAGIPKKEQTVYVLTDSTELTYDDVTWSMLSSDTRSVTKIPFVWLPIFK